MSYCCRALLQLADLLLSYDIPLMLCRSYGFLGYMRLVLKEHTGENVIVLFCSIVLHCSNIMSCGLHCFLIIFSELLENNILKVNQQPPFSSLSWLNVAVVESHPDSSLDDLRLQQPFPALEQYCDSLDLDTMSKKDHSHTPWLIIIYKYLQKWKAEVNENTYNISFLKTFEILIAYVIQCVKNRCFPADISV